MINLLFFVKITKFFFFLPVYLALINLQMGLGLFLYRVESQYANGI